MSLLNLVAKLTLDTSEYEASLGKAESSAGGFGNAFKKVADIGIKAFTAATAAVGAFTVASVKTGMDFDKSMSQVAATMGMSMSEMENKVGEVDLAWGHFSGNLREYAQEMGANTAFSAKQSADALNYMALAGYDAQTSMEMLPNVMNLAAAGSMDLARASDMVTDTQTAFGISLERTSQMVDEMAKAASTGNTSVEQLGDAFLTVGGLAKELNGGFVTLADGTQAPVDGIQEMEIALTAMANAGIKGSEAGTHMRNMIMKLSSPTKEGVKQMEALGVAVFDDAGNMRSLQDIMGDLNGALGNLTQEEKIQAIADLFNARDLSSAEALLGAVEQDWNKIGESILDAEGAAQKMADTQLDNLAGDITLFQSALEGAQIALSDKVTPALRDFVKEGTEGISGFTKKLNEGDINGAMESIGKSIGTAFTKALTLGPQLLSAGGSLINGLVAGMSAAVAQVDFVHVVIPMLVGLSGKIREKSGELVTAGIDIVKGIGQGIENGGSTFSIQVQTIFSNMLGAITDNIPLLFEAGLELLNGLGEGIGENLPSFLENTVLPMLTQFSEFVREGAGQLVDTGIDFILNLAQGIMDSLPTLIEQVPQIIINFAGAINDNAPKLLVGGVQLIWIIIQGIISAIPTLIANIPKIFEAVLAVWTALNWVNLGKNVIEFIKNGVEQLMNNVPQALKDIGAKAIEWFKGVDWAHAGTQAINFIRSAILGMATAVPTTLLNIGKQAWNWFKGVDWYSLGSNIIHGIVNGLNAGIGWLKEKARQVAEDALNAAKDFLGIKSPSKVFRDEVGKMITAGLSIGIDDGAVDAIKSAERLSKSVFKPFDDLDAPVVSVTAESGAMGAFSQDFGGVMAEYLRTNNEALTEAFYTAFMMVMREGGFTMQIDGREFGRVLRESGVQMA